ncbi:hypothetical protein OSB04_028469 [Centaurea solstitialis]|uniref:AAA+ ATPase domain-containing protein n=1 Tax=Centaurea solstitialis TaxID=347529 RepID=A0AA38SGJ4_9ASTR|nr:hypothetical protein OSB04_028469 [Centaurea solstitialis]
MGSRLKTQTIKSRHVVWKRQRRSCVIKKLNYKTIVPNGSCSSSSTSDCERKAAAAAAAGVNVMMSHKYKPKVFQDVVGHKTVIKTLSNAIQHKKIAPLYLFHGPNGTGKTSTATVFAMALNCQSTHQPKPCCTCKPCTSFKATTTICSANTIATAFHKIKTTSSLPTTQILIIEDCHLLTSEAWDELMNLLDSKSNPSLVFLLITTSINNSNNIPNHISSRCHKFCFPKLKDEDITKKLSTILHHEGMSIQKQAMKLIVAKSQGSLRDAENILEQLALLGPRINTSVTQHLVGLIPQNKLLDLLAVAISGDTINTIRYAKKLSASVEPASFLSQLATLVTNVLLESSSSPHKKLLSKTHSARLCYILKLLAETERKLQSSTDQNWNIIAAFLDITSSTSSIVLPNSSSFSQVTLHSGEPHRSIDERQRQLDGMKRSSISDMEELWKDVLEGIESSHTRKFLRDQVKLALLSISRTNAIVHLTFQRPEDKLAAEISEESLTKALEVAIGCPVTVRMSLEPLTLGQDGRSRILSGRHSQQQNATTESSGFNGIIGQPSAESSRLRKSKSCSTSQRPHRYSSKGRDLNTAQLQNLSPESHLTNQRRDLDLIQAAAGDSKNAKQIMRANRPRHRWLSLSSIPQSDASVECYSQDVKYENSNKDGDDIVRKIPKFQKDNQIQRGIALTHAVEDVKQSES